jgi:predicted enzyme related to lactoylglutathione lyase
MADITKHQPGTFCWIELATSDAGGSKKFYTDLFGWTTTETDMGNDMGLYYIFHKDGKEVAAMYQMAGDMAGMPPNWLSYVAVDSADDAAAKANSLGAQSVHGPFDVFDMGRMAVIRDSQGAHFAVWQARQHGGIGVRDEENTLCWNELQAADVAAGREFYPALFGWRAKESAEYTEWHLGEHAIGGMIQLQGPPGVPAHWLPYFAVADCDRTVERAQSAGASTFVPPMDIEKVGRFAVLADPQGAVFAVIKLQLG